MTPSLIRLRAAYMAVCVFCMGASVQAGPLDDLGRSIGNSVSNAVSKSVDSALSGMNSGNQTQGNAQPAPPAPAQTAHPANMQVQAKPPTSVAAAAKAGSPGSTGGPGSACITTEPAVNVYKEPGILAKSICDYQLMLRYLNPGQTKCGSWILLGKDRGSSYLMPLGAKVMAACRLDLKVSTGQSTDCTCANGTGV